MIYDAMLADTSYGSETLILAHDIAEILANGESSGTIRDALPVRTEEQIEAAVLYDQAYPRRGRSWNTPFWRSR